MYFGSMATHTGFPTLGFLLQIASPNGQWTAHSGLGVAQIVLGSLCIVCNTVALIFLAYLSFISIGIWGGIMMIIAGSFGVAAAKRKTKCTVITTLVMSILSAVVGCGLLLNSLFGMIMDINSDFSKTEAAMNACLLILGVTEMVIAIIQASFCCRTLASTDATPYQVLQVSRQASTSGLASSENEELYIGPQGKRLQAGSIVGGSIQLVTSTSYPPVTMTATGAQDQSHDSNKDSDPMSSDKLK